MMLPVGSRETHDIKDNSGWTDLNVTLGERGEKSGGISPYNNEQHGRFFNTYVL